MTIAIAIIENKYNAQEFYFFPLTKGRIKSILKVPKRNFRNNTNRDLKPQKDKNSIFYAVYLMFFGVFICVFCFSWLIVLVFLYAVAKKIEL
nr:hypothetical protein [Escherichia coli]